jgi:heterodisulfide reductase subunit C
MTAVELEFNFDTAKSLVQEVMERSDQNLLACYQCRRCASGCPVGEETGYVTPDRLIRMLVLGDRESALNNDLVWKCLSCYTCGTRCPNEIQTARVTETLKKISKETRQKPRAPKVAHFHSSFVSSAVRWGRLNEIEFINFYEIKNTLTDLKSFRFKAIFSEMIAQGQVGLNMLRRKRLHFRFQSAKGRKEIKRLYQRAKTKQRG